MAGSYNATIYTGETFSRTITWNDASGNPVNLTGFTAKMDLRTKPGGTLVVTLSTANFMITLGGVAGTITLTIPATTTATYSPQECVYDLFLTSGSGVVTRLLAGSVPVQQSITQ